MLCLKWNKAEIAKDILDYLHFNNDRSDFEFYFIELGLIEKSLLINRPDIFELYLNEFDTFMGFWKQFLKANTLYYLYNFNNKVFKKKFNLENKFPF